MEIQDFLVRFSSHHMQNTNLNDDSFKIYTDNLVIPCESNICAFYFSCGFGLII